MADFGGAPIVVASPVTPPPVRVGHPVAPPAVVVPKAVAEPASTEPGQPKFSGQGPPGVVIGASPGDEYLDVTSGDIYQLG